MRGKTEFGRLVTGALLCLVVTLAASGQNGKGNPNSRTIKKSLPTRSSLLTEEEEEEFRIGKGDILQISVWREPELSSVVAIRPDGKISLPLVNEVYVVGMTPMELQEELVKEYKRFVNTPVVSVRVQQINSRKIYIFGNVGRQGAFPISRNITVLEAIAEAGGLVPFAKAKNIYVLRNVDGVPIRLPFNYKAVIRGKHSEQNIILKPGDIIYVP